MDADELISVIERAAQPFARRQVATFVQSVRQDLEYFREPLNDRPEWVDAEFPEERRAVNPRRPTPPEKYSDAPELWIVFSSFLAHFVDPVGAAVEVMRYAAEEERRGLQRIALVRDFREDPRGGELDLFDRQRLEDDYAVLIELAAELGREAFGERFRVTDFVEQEGG